MKNYLFAFLCVGIFTTSSLGQGCVAVRHLSCSVGTGANSNSMMHPGQWQISLGFRNLHSYKHYVGADYQPAREVAGTNVINDQQSFDLGVTYSLTDRLSVAVNLPLNSNGIGDARLTASYWLLDPLKHMNGNLSVGLGLKLPTGDWKAMDKFHRRSSDGSDYTIDKPVDQSIQLGDGGLGINLEIQGYQQLFKRTSIYYSGFYMSNPRNVNDAANVAPDKVVTDEMVRYMSVADQYAARLGLNYALAPKAGIGATIGARIEGVPAYDLIGDSDGFRRPGYIFSIEPGISYSTAKNTFFVSMPIATQRNRIKSASDWVNNKHGDAAFADYFISATVTHRF